MPTTTPPAIPWLARLSNLKTGRGPTGKPAPHKPVMLLVLADLVEAGELTTPRVPFNVYLTQRFRDYWSLVAARQPGSPDIRQPFYHLHSAGVWQPLTADGQPSGALATTRLCDLDPELWTLMQLADFRLALRKALIARYFEPLEQVGLCASLGLPVPDTAEIAAICDDAAAWKSAQQKGRDSRFKSTVLAGYHYTCALTGYRLMTETSALVQAAHIEQHARTGNDDPKNGLALTPDAHWLFDNGLWTVRPAGDALLVEVKHDAFAETGGDRLQAKHGQPLHFHPSASLRPAVEFLRWHARRWHFGAAA